MTPHEIGSPFDGTLEVVSSLRDDLIETRVLELAKDDRLTLGLRSALRMGVPISDLSEASGLSVNEIQRRVESDLRVVGEDLDALAGV